MKSEDFRRRLEAVRGNPVEVAVLMGEQAQEISSASQLRVLEQMAAMRDETLLLRGDMNQLRVTQANMLTVVAGDLTLALRAQGQRFDARLDEYAKHATALVQALADAAHAQHQRDAALSRMVADAVRVELAELRGLIGQHTADTEEHAA